MTTISAELTTRLWEIFPDAFSTTKVVTITETFNGRFGTEEITKGTETEILATCILTTAQAFSRGGNCMDSALRYLEGFRGAKTQAREIKNFLK